MPTRFRRARLAGAALVTSILLLAALSLYHGLLADLPSPADLPRRVSHGTTKIVDRQGRLLYEVLDPLAGQRTVISLNEFPLHLRQATVATEDASFYENPGLDPRGILRAAYLNVVEGEAVAGGSTITQQVARRCLLSDDERGERSLRRKLCEAILAWQLAQSYSKDEVLALYLNQVYYGNLAYGAEAAARVYFGVHARDLDLAQCAFLAGLPQAPVAYDPFTNLDAAKRRQRVVLDLMAKRGAITPEQAERAAGEPLHLVGYGAGIQAPHFVHLVRQQLEDRYGSEAVIRGGWRITTTLDLDLQTYAEAVVRRRMTEMHQYDAQLYSGHEYVTPAASVRAYVLYGLAEAGAGDYGLARSLYERRNERSLPHYARAYLALALYLSNDNQADDAVGTLLDELEQSAAVPGDLAYWAEASADRYAMNTNVRSTAIVLDALVRIRPTSSLIPKSVRWLMGQRRGPAWGNTQETSVTLIALLDYLVASGELQADYSYRVTIDGQEAAAGVVGQDNRATPVRVLIPASRLPAGGEHTVDVTRWAAPGQTGKGVLHYTLLHRSYQPGGGVAAVSQGLTVQWARRSTR